MHGLILRSALDACAMVDELGPDATGEIGVFDAEGRRGAVFVERGRVCWAAARGLSRRLTEILSARAAVSRDEMERLFRSCQARRLPLGEELVSRGLLDACALEHALLEHTVESLDHLCALEARASWSARSGPGYSLRFTFPAAEILVRSCAGRHPGHADAAARVLDASFGDDDWAAAFVRSGAAAFPEPVARRGTAPRSTSALLGLGKWAASGLDVVGTFNDDEALLCVTRDDATALVAFRWHGLVVAGETSAHGPARILNRRATRRRRAERGEGDADL